MHFRKTLPTRPDWLNVEITMARHWLVIVIFPLPIVTSAFSRSGRMGRVPAKSTLTIVWRSEQQDSERWVKANKMMAFSENSSALSIILPAQPHIFFFRSDFRCSTAVETGDSVYSGFLVETTPLTR